MYYFVNGQKSKYINQNLTGRPIETGISKVATNNHMKNIANDTPCPLTIYSVLLGIALVGLIIYLLCVVFFKKHKKKH